MAGESKYAKNAEGLCRAFGLKLSPNKKKHSLAVVGRWTGSPGFPEKTAHGWVIAEVRRWREEQNPDLFQKSGKHYLDQLCDRIKNFDPADPLSVSDLKLVERLRPEVLGLPPIKPEEAEGGGRRAEIAEETPDANYLPAENQKVLALRLTLIFQGQIGIDLSETQISRWKTQADSLPPGVPAPPPKLGNRFSTKDWADWVRKFILPHYPFKRSAQGSLAGVSIHEEARTAKSREEIASSEIKLIELAAAKGRFGPVEKFKAARRGALKLLDGAMARQWEDVSAIKRMVDRAIELGMPPVNAIILTEFILSERRADVDAIQGEYKKLLGQELEQKIVEQEK